MRGIAPLLFIAASLLAVIPSRAEFVHDKIRSMDGFHYLAKFCYDYTAPASATQGPDQYENTMTLSVFFKAETDEVPKDLRLYVYDDQANSWPAVYGKNIPCEQKVAKARNSTAVTFDAATNTWQMPLARIHEHVRPRFWYIVAANCKGFKDLEYEIRFTNKGKSSWDREFGVNEQGLNTLYLVYFLVYTVGVLIHMYALQSVMCSKKMHPIVKLLTATIVLQYLSVFLGLVHYGVFVSNGSGVPVLKGFSEAAQVFAKLCFMLLLIFVAQGWTISTDRLTTKTQIYLVLIVFVVAYLALLIWDVTGRDPASTLYVYESVPGVSIVCLDIFTGLWFIWSIKDTYSEESDTDKKSFYMYIGFGYALWFLTLPIIVTIAAYLHPWAREIIVTSISLTATTIAYFALMILLWPSRAEGYFRISGPDVAADHDDDDL